MDIPERERLCIFAAAFALSEGALFAAAILTFGGFDVPMCAEVDMEVYVQGG